MGLDASAGPDLTTRRARHALAKETLYSALDLEPAARAAFLDDACSADAELRRDVESLLSFADDPIASRAPGLPVEAVALLAPLHPGEMVAARYRIEALLGEGGMGQVYRARDTLLDVAIALKRVRVRGPVHRRRLLEEARLARQVTHPSVCRIYDAGDDDSQTFVTMELLDGIALSQRLAEVGRFTSARVARLGRELCEGLAAAHGAGVLHGDLKPSNLMIDGAGRVHILDFGLARALAPSPGHALAAGSPAYMAPEQLDDDGVVDERTDLHAVGLILHEALTGRLAFQAASPQELLDQVRNAVPPPPSTLTDEVDPTLDHLIRRLVEKDPAKRPASAAEIAALLSRDGPVATPPVKRRGGRLPRPLTSLVGRRAQLRELETALEEQPLITLIGTGGSGKTRLAVEAARRLADGGEHAAWFADLSGLRDRDRVIHEVARVLDARTEGARHPIDAIVEVLRDRKGLVVLDNCEHLRDAAAAVAIALLEELPDLRILATSREALGVPGEHVIAVAPLARPPVGLEGEYAALAAVESVRLFLDRAHAVQPGLELDASSAPLVARICRRLDGLPLALELAATQLRSLALEDVASLLGAGLQAIESHDPLAPPRHRTLHDLVEWSHSQLDADATVLFRRLSVFAGGFTLAKVERTCAFPPLEPGGIQRVLAGLADRSLVQVERRGVQVRHRLLETFRFHAAERLAEAGEEEALRDEHLQSFLRLALSAEKPLDGPQSAAWVTRLEPEIDNVRAALEFARTTSRRAADGLRLAVALWPFFQARGRTAEIRDSIEALLGVTGNDDRGDDAAAIGWACHVAGLARGTAGYTEQARDLQQRASAIAQRRDDAELLAHGLWGLGQAAADAGDVEAGRRHLAEACRVARAGGARRGLARAINGLGSLEFRLGAYDAARERFEEALGLVRAEGLARLEVQVLANLGVMEMQVGQFPDARPLLEASLALGLKLDAGRPFLQARSALGIARLREGDARGAAEALAPALEQALEERNAQAVATIAFNLADAHAQLDQLEAADACLRGALGDPLTRRSRRGSAILASALVNLRMRQGRHAEAARLFGAVNAEWERVGGTLTPADGEARTNTEAALRAVQGESIARLLAEGAASPLGTVVQDTLGP